MTYKAKQNQPLINLMETNNNPNNKETKEKNLTEIAYTQ